MTAVLRVLAGVLLGAAAGIPLVTVLGNAHGRPRAHYRLVPEDGSGHLRRIAIHYAPALDDRALPVWRRLFAVLPADITVEVAVERARDFERLMAALHGIDHLDRFRPVVVNDQLTTWSRDRMASLAGPLEEGAVLAPPRVATATAARSGDWKAPFALSQAAYGEKAHVADFVFEGGDLAASRRFLFADVNLETHNLGRGDSTADHLQAELKAQFTQELVWLGEEPGSVPQHHIMMYMVPLDDAHVAVGDVQLGASLLGESTLPLDEDQEAHARHFDHVAELLAARGFVVTRFPVVVLKGAGSYVTYTNALFDRDAGGKVVYLPTYQQPALDAYARNLYEKLGYRVVEVDLSTMYQLNGSLGCLVNVMARI